MKTITINVPLDDLLAEPNNYTIQLSFLPAHNKAISSKSETEPLFFDYMSLQEQRLKKQGKIRTAETYRVTLSSLRQFRKEQNFNIEEMNQDMMLDYECWLINKGIKPNSTSFYMRILRAVYNRAINELHKPNKSPFKHVYTGIAKTSKRAIGIEEINKLLNLEINEKRQRFARDMFMFSLYTRGMSFIDMAYLKKSSLRNGILYYKRHKTGQEISIKWENSMQQILDRNPSVNSDYLLPIIRKQNGKERNQYRHQQRIVNEALHSLTELLGLKQALTMYVARHSWASIAMSLNIPMNIISRGMGHDSERTTQVYLTEIDNGRIDNANKLILAAIDNNRN